MREDAGYAIDGSSLRRIDLATHEVTATNDTDVASGVFGVGGDALYAGSPTGGVAILDPVTLELRRAIGSDPVVAPDGGKWSLGLRGRERRRRRRRAGAWVRFDAATVGRVDPASGHDHRLRRAVSQRVHRRERDRRLGRVAVGHEHR